MNRSATTAADPVGRQRNAKAAYRQELRRLQVALTRLQRHIIQHGHKLLVILEGRDAAGKDGVIKRIAQHLSPRETRIVALGRPTDRDRGSWYFQRYVAHLPSAEEMVLFNRSWYNRAGVERVMGFCTHAELAQFFEAVVPFERMLVDSGIQIVKYYLDISRPEQRRRLHARRNDPLSQWKVSPIDGVALKKWKDYSQARNEMLVRTNDDVTPWFVVRADDKQAARLNLIRHLLAHVDCPDKDEHAATPDAEIVFRFDDACLTAGRLAV